MGTICLESRDGCNRVYGYDNSRTLKMMRSDRWSKRVRSSNKTKFARRLQSEWHVSINELFILESCSLRPIMRRSVLEELRFWSRLLEIGTGRHSNRQLLFRQSELTVGWVGSWFGQTRWIGTVQMCWNYSSGNLRKHNDPTQ